MDKKLLQEILDAPDEKTLRALAETHALGEDAVRALKDLSARFYFDQPAQALRVAGTALQLGQLLPAPSPALGRWAMANALLFADRYRQAAELFDRARAGYLSLGAELEAARMGVGHVWALAYTGAFERALDLAAEIEPVLAAASETDPADHRRLGGLFNNVGIIYDLLGRYEESLAAYDHKLAIAQALKNKLDAARTQHNRACALTYLNAFGEAMTAFDVAEEGLDAAGAVADLVRLDINRGILYASRERYAEAEVMLAQADRRLETMDGMAQQRQALAVYRGLARLYAGQVDVSLRQAFSEAQAVLAVHGPPFEEGLASWGQGRCCLALKEWEDARVAFARVRALADQGVGRSLAYLALCGLGNLEEALGRTEEAVAAYRSAIQQVETVRQELKVEVYRAGFLADKLTAYQDLTALYVRVGQTRQAFATVERAKARLLAERLDARLRDDARALDAAEDPNVRRLAGQLRDVLAQLEDLYGEARLAEGSAGGAEWPLSLPSEPMAEVEALEGKALGLIRQIERLQPAFSSLATAKSVPLDRVQALLGDALLIQYTITHGTVRAFLVDHSGIRACVDLAPLDEIQEALGRFSTAVERALDLTAQFSYDLLARFVPSLVADAQAHLATLYDLLLRPLATGFSAGQALLISPDGPLHYVPFHALYEGSSYLLEDHIVSYTPSAAVLELQARRVSTDQGMLVLGYGGSRLNQVDAEVAALTHLFPGADLATGSDATAKWVLDEAPGHAVLHLAAHAKFRADNVMLSYLELADRRLTLAEIACLRLDAELVTLSACETGRGQLHGSDLLSLASGFVGAGARSLLVSLWRVDDRSTARLMDTFYRALYAGNGRAAALRAAQREILDLGRESPSEHGIYCHPAYWASFVLVGERGELFMGGKTDA